MSETFSVREVASATGSYFVASDPRTGIMTCGRATRAEALDDARVLNAAYDLGRAAGEAQAEERAAGDKPDSEIVTLMRAAIDQNRPYMMRFVSRHDSKELIQLFKDEIKNGNAERVLSGTCAMYGLMTAILEHEQGDERC